jgi:hypothetical protein
MKREVFEPAPNWSAYSALYEHSVSSTVRVPVDGDKMVQWAKESPEANKLMAITLSLVARHHGWSSDFVERVRDGRRELVAWLSQRPFLLELWWDAEHGICVCIPALWDSWQLSLGVMASPQTVLVRQALLLDGCLEQLRQTLALDVRRQQEKQQLRIGQIWDYDAKTQNPDQETAEYPTPHKRDAQGSKL